MRGVVVKFLAALTMLLFLFGCLNQTPAQPNCSVTLEPVPQINAECPDCNLTILNLDRQSTFLVEKGHNYSFVSTALFENGDEHALFKNDEGKLISLEIHGSAPAHSSAILLQLGDKIKLGSKEYAYCNMELEKVIFCEGMNAGFTLTRDGSETRLDNASLRLLAVLNPEDYVHFGETSNVLVMECSPECSVIKK